MALKIETIPTLTQLPPMVILIEGKPKTGKTSAALKWPRPLLVDFPAEDGATFHPGTKRVMVRQWSDMAEVPSLAVDFDTVIIDTLQAMWGVLTNHAKVEWQDYAGHYASFVAALQAITSTGKHVVLVSHTKDEYEGKGDAKRFVRSAVQLPGQLAERVAGYADQILHTYVDDLGEHLIRCKAGDGKEAGGRLSGLPVYFPFKPSTNIYAGLEKAFSEQVRPTSKTEQKASK